jgi:hypothetical protein
LDLRLPGLRIAEGGFAARIPGWPHCIALNPIPFRLQSVRGQRAGATMMRAEDGVGCLECQSVMIVAFIFA